MMARYLQGLTSLFGRSAPRVFTSLQRHCTTESKYVPRRACLYVPGNDERKFRKIPNLGVDCVIMDCEDGVALNRKEEARLVIKKMLDELDFGQTEPIVRINSVNSGLAEDDITVILQAEKVPPTFMVPKVDNMEQIDWINDQLTPRLKKKGHKDKVNLIIYVESAISLLNLKDICQHGVKISSDTESCIKLDGIVFGSDDFLADIGGTRTKEAKELLYARQHVVTVAKAYRLHAIDIVYIDFKDTEGLKQQSLDGALMGFTGKQCIHPDQVAVIQEAFMPSPEKIKWARELIEAFKKHQQSGKGAFTFQGSMIDMPLLLQAKNIIQIVDHTRSS